MDLTPAFLSGSGDFFSLFSFPQRVSLLPPSSTKMVSSPLCFSGDFDDSTSSDMHSTSHSSNRNPGFTYPSDMGSSEQSSAHEFGGHFLSPEFNRSRPQSAFSHSSVCIPVSPLFLTYIVQQHPTPQTSFPFPQTNTYGRVPSHTNGPFEELQRMRAERDHWRLKFYEQS